MLYTKCNAVPGFLFFLTVGFLAAILCLVSVLRYGKKASSCAVGLLACTVLVVEGLAVDAIRQFGPAFFQGTLGYLAFLSAPVSVLIFVVALLVAAPRPAHLLVLSLSPLLSLAAVLSVIAAFNKLEGCKRLTIIPFFTFTKPHMYLPLYLGIQQCQTLILHFSVLKLLRRKRLFWVMYPFALLVRVAACAATLQYVYQWVTPCLGPLWDSHENMVEDQFKDPASARYRMPCADVPLFAVMLFTTFPGGLLLRKNRCLRTRGCITLFCVEVALAVCTGILISTIGFLSGAKADAGAVFWLVLVVFCVGPCCCFLCILWYLFHPRKGRHPPFNNPSDSSDAGTTSSSEPEAHFSDGGVSNGALHAANSRTHLFHVPLDMGAGSPAILDLDAILEVGVPGDATATAAVRALPHSVPNSGATSPTGMVHNDSNSPTTNNNIPGISNGRLMLNFAHSRGGGYYPTAIALVRMEPSAPPLPVQQVHSSPDDVEDTNEPQNNQALYSDNHGLQPPADEARPPPTAPVVNHQAAQLACEDPTEECPICLQPFGDDVVWTPCCHKFCRDCLRECLQRNSRCPQCRHNIVDDEEEPQPP